MSPRTSTAAPSAASRAHMGPPSQTREAPEKPQWTPELEALQQAWVHRVVVAVMTLVIEKALDVGRVAVDVLGARRDSSCACTRSAYNWTETVVPHCSCLSNHLQQFKKSLLQKLLNVRCRPCQLGYARSRASTSRARGPVCDVGGVWWCIQRYRNARDRLLLDLVPWLHRPDPPITPLREEPVERTPTHLPALLLPTL
ncbi:hypothetical protein FIBSPDRAFT_886476 [Athelia psychrophila]|uniref:Uncharacterized protein n=1 Tax=Athelia psychrophila TaxID=1759441 RepID=A0A166QVC8_9AGAM|nr:hypothetical protein FIBSPDRAFT_886476 [Fibularhizoctonia sp. CBS 109695]